MTKQEVLKHLCQTVALVYYSIENYDQASDGFCSDCLFSDDPVRFRHSGTTLTYVREAVVAKLKADGFNIAKEFDPITGNEIKEQANASVKE